jgi:hypothetical protein
LPENPVIPIGLRRRELETAKATKTGKVRLIGYASMDTFGKLH